jgi:hypothetical protein
MEVKLLQTRLAISSFKLILVLCSMAYFPAHAIDAKLKAQTQSIRDFTDTVYMPYVKAIQPTENQQRVRRTVKNKIKSLAEPVIGRGAQVKSDLEGVQTYANSANKPLDDDIKRAVMASDASPAAKRHYLKYVKQSGGAAEVINSSIRALADIESEVKQDLRILDSKTEIASMFIGQAHAASRIRCIIVGGIIGGAAAGGAYPIAGAALAWWLSNC